MKPKQVIPGTLVKTTRDFENHMYGSNVGRVSQRQLAKNRSIARKQFPRSFFRTGIIMTLPDTIGRIDVLVLRKYGPVLHTLNCSHVTPIKKKLTDLFPLEL